MRSFDEIRVDWGDRRRKSTRERANCERKGLPALESAIRPHSSTINAAMQRHDIVQQEHYDKQTRRTVCHQYFVLGMTQAQIAHLYDNHPCQRTVSEIVRSYINECNSVVVPPGNHGRRHSDRKFDMDAWDHLVRILEMDEQFYLHGDW